MHDRLGLPGPTLPYPLRANASRRCTMPAEILDGKAVARSLQDEMSVEVADFIHNNGFVPCLAAILVGEDPASAVYVRNKRRACEYVGLESELHQLSDDTSRDDLHGLIASLNKRTDVHGILLQ